MLIGEVAARTGVSARMLRHYDALGLVVPSERTAGGYRSYAAADLRRLLHVEALRSLGLALAEVGRALDDPAFVPAALLDDLAERARRRIEQEQALLDRLRAVGGAGPADWDEALRVVRLLRDLGSEHAAVRQAAVLAGDRPLPATGIAESLLAEEDVNVAGALRWALTPTDEAVAVLRRGLEDEDVAVRRRAAAALAGLPGAPAGAALEAALGDDDPDVRDRAALALAARGSVAMLSALVDMIVRGARDVEAAEALGSLATDPATGRRAIAALQAVLDDPAAAAATRHRVVQALAELPPADTRAVLDRLTGDADPVVARTARAVRRTQG